MARKRTAIVFVHGQGDQSPMDDLLQLAYTVWETDPKAAAAGQLGNLLSVPMDTPEDGDIRRLITDEVNGRQFHFYQYYWAHLMEGNAVVDVWRWLLHLLKRPPTEVPPALVIVRRMLSAILFCMGAAAILLATLTCARLLSPPHVYGALIANAYAILWAAVAVALVVMMCRGRRSLGLFIPFCVSVILSGVIFGLALTSLVAGDGRILKDVALSSSTADRAILEVACALDSNPEQSLFRSYCAALPERQVQLAKQSPPTWWHVASAGHRFLIGACVFFAVALTLVWGFASPFLKDVMADSARYFSNSPTNVAQRDKVRSRGVTLLQRLHAMKKYDRIVVVGHSLGTVVAYGMLDHYWGLVSGRFELRHRKELADLEDAARDLDYARDADIVACRAEYRRAQRQLTRAMAQSGQTRDDWVISDFVTLGSPLTYAPLLMADSKGEFVAKMRKLFRLPSNPPATVEGVTDGDCTDYNFTGEWIGRATGARRALWPSAMFAALRWTNLYFSHNGLARGDIVGGPVAPTFGRGVLDIPMDRKVLGTGFLHNEYWKWPGQTKASAWAPAGDTRAYTKPPFHIARLRQAMNLFDGGELEAQLNDPKFSV